MPRDTMLSSLGARCRHLILVLLLAGGASLAAADREVVVGNLVYGGGKTSRCFADHFLSEVRSRTAIQVQSGFARIHLDRSEELFTVGFAIMNGQGPFRLASAEREHLRQWLGSGGFLLASAGCSDGEWARSMRRELAETFGSEALVKLTTEHALFHTLFDIDKAPLKSGKPAKFEGIILDGRLVCLFSAEGLNNTAKVSGCCCCSGDEVKIASEVVANALVYSLVE